MARLIVFQDGKKLNETDLSSKNEWVVGRGEDSDILLANDKAISRQHLIIYSENGRWVVDVLSRYGELYQSGRKVQSIRLEPGQRFEVPPFEFQFENQVETVSQTPAVVEQVQENVPARNFEDSLSGQTRVGISNVTAFLKVCNEGRKVVQNFHLEGHIWTAGRETSCAIFIDNIKFSRRHFEIRVEENAYMIRDLGSSNGTILNGQRLRAEEWTQIASGDVITVVDWNLFFELRDSEFQGQLLQVSDQLLPAQSYTLDLSNGPVASFPQMSGAVSSNSSRKTPKMNWVRILIAVILVGGCGYYLLDEPPPPPVRESKEISKSPNSMDRLKPQQQQYVKDTYRLADRLFKEGRYEMARQEVAKIHELVPFYEESKNLEKLSEVAIQSQIEQQKAETREREKVEMEAKIQAAVEACDKRINGSVEMKFIDECLSDVMALNPEHPLIIKIKGRVDQIIADRAVRDEKRAEYQSLARKQKALFDKAAALAEKGSPLESLDAFSAVVNNKLPDPKNYRGEAKRMIASLQKKISDQQSEMTKEADAAYKKGDLKGTVLSLKKALEVNPENEILKGRINSTLGEMKKQMQVYYQEGILEESVGEVETAKSKWKKIIELSLPDEDYYKKARIKLKKYGID